MHSPVGTTRRDGEATPDAFRQGSVRCGGGVAPAVRPAADAEDVAQSVFVKLYQSLDRLRETERLASWLITTAHRETWRVGRKSDRYPDLDERMGDVAAPADDEARRLEQQQLVRQALERLGGRCEQLLTLLFLKCPPVDYETIARDCGMSVGSIGATRRP